MGLELFAWLKDVGQIVEVGGKQKQLRQTGQGTDYTADEYRDLVRLTVDKLHPTRMRLRVREIITETPSTKTLRCLRIDGPLPPFRAGQYVNVFIEIDGVSTSRPYSLSSRPGDDHVDLTVRDRPDGFVAPYLLNEVLVGDELNTTGPSGGFYYEPLIDGEQLVFLAGGSGITPFMSIIRQAATEQRPPTIHLLYGTRTIDDVIFGAELKRLDALYPWLNFTLVVSEPPAGYDGVRGLLDAATIEKAIGGFSGQKFMLCGPNVMLSYCLEQLSALGVPVHKIRRELYGPPDDVTREPGWPEGLVASQEFQAVVEGKKTIAVKAGEPLLCSLERHGLVVPAVCRAGECSSCRVRLVSGKVFMPAHAGVRESDRRFGYIHSCVAFPLSDLHIDI